MKKQLKIIILSLITVTLLMGIYGNVKATEENIEIEKTVTNYEQFQSENGGEVVLKVKKLELNSNVSYQYQLKYNELETQWYNISNLDLENNILNITLEKSKNDILAILKVTDTAYLTIQEVNENTDVQTILDNKEIDISLPLSKGFKVGHWTTGYHGIANTYNVENILYKYVKVQDREIIEDYLEYLRGYDSNQDDIYWGYYVDNLIDEMDMSKNIPNTGWEVLEGNTTTTKPTEEGLYFIWIKAPETENHKEIIGCVFSKKFRNISVLEQQLEDVKNSEEELTATVTYNPTTNTSGNVTATIETNKEINEVDGWTLSDSRKILTKVYSTNTTETVHLIDIYGKTADVVIRINNIVKLENEKIEETEKPEETPKDTTVTPNKIPHAGESVEIVFALAAVIVIGIIIYFKYRKIKDI